MRTRFALQSEHAGAGLLKAGYLIALLLVLVPIVDTITRTWPVRLGDERWRFGTLGIVLNAMVTPLLGVFLAMIIAAALEHGRTLRLVAVVTIVAAVVVVVAIPFFGLDYVQLRAGVTAEAMDGFDAAARKAIGVGALAAAVTLVLGITGWRTAGRVSARRSEDNVGLVRPNEEKT
jgi:hypothetical protein